MMNKIKKIDKMVMIVKILSRRIIDTGIRKEEETRVKINIMRDMIIMIDMKNMIEMREDINMITKKEMIDMIGMINMINIRNMTRRIIMIDEIKMIDMVMKIEEEGIIIKMNIKMKHRL